MKTLFKRLFAGFFLLLSCTFPSCNNSSENILPVEDVETSPTIDQIIQEEGMVQARAGKVSFYKGIYNSEIYGAPGTKYTWGITDYGIIKKAPYVKLYGPDHKTFYLKMKRHAGKHWVLQSKLSKTGYYSWRYVNSDKNNLTSWNSWLVQL